MSVDWIREHCLSFPSATEQVKWGEDLVFKVGGKMFAVLCLTPAVPTKMSFKASSEKFHELTEIPGIIPAPYLARAEWVALESFDALRSNELKDLLRESYDLVLAKLPKRTQEQLAAGKSAKAPPSKEKAGKSKKPARPVKRKPTKTTKAKSRRKK